jgi:hypothetical protein
MWQKKHENRIAEVGCAHDAASFTRLDLRSLWQRIYLRRQSQWLLVRRNPFERGTAR